MNFTIEFILSLVAALATGGGAYAAVRADLAKLHERSMAAIQRLDRLEGRIFK